MRKNILFLSPVQMSQQPAILLCHFKWNILYLLNTYSCDITNNK